MTDYFWILGIVSRDKVTDEEVKRKYEETMAFLGTEIGD